VQAWRQGLVIPTLVLSDILLASLLWGLAIVLQVVWGQGSLLAGPTLAYITVNTALWIGLRALLRLYPGYGLSPAEELRRQTYAGIATLAIVAIFAFGLQAGDQLSRLLVALNFLERLFLAPVWRHFVKGGMAKLGLWGKPVVVLGAGQAGRQLVQGLKEEWGLGLRPVGVFDFRLTKRGGALEAVPSPGRSVAHILDRARKQGIDTAVFAMPQVRKQYLEGFIKVARRCFEHVIIVPNLSGITTSAVTARDL